MKFKSIFFKQLGKMLATQILAVLLTYVDIKKRSKFGAESILYAGVTLALQYTQAGEGTGGQGMVSSNLIVVSLCYNSHVNRFSDPKFYISHS